MAATDLDRLVLQLSADVKGLEKGMAKMQGITNAAFKAVEKRARESSKQVDATFANLGAKAATSIAAIGAAFGTKELVGLSDDWTRFGNKLSATSQATGMQARSLSALKDDADDARASLDAYADLYTRLMRSSSGVAKNEQEIARATNIASKAFVAGGAAASEQAAAVLQLGQALGSGNLQGDELRSIRENAPLLAKAIADEFGTTIAGLKELGAEGKLTSDRVFKAILNAGSEIEKQFDATNATIADGFTRIKNAMTEYVGIGGQATGVSQSITQGLIMIADNFDKVAQAGLVVSGIIAGQLVGRSLPAMIKRLLEAGTATKGLISALMSAKTLGDVAGGLAKGGPAFAVGGAVIGGAVLFAMNEYMQRSAESAERTKTLKQELQSMGLISNHAAEKIAELSKATGDVGSAENLRRLQMINEELDRMRNGSIFSNGDDIPSLIKKAQNSVGGGDDAKALVSIKEYLETVKELPSAAFQGDEAMQVLRDSMDLTDPMKKLTYEIQDAMQIMRGHILNARIKGEDIIDPSINEQLDALGQKLDEVFSSDAFSDDKRQALKRVWEEFRNGEISAEELRKKIDELGGTYAIIQGGLLPAFQNITKELQNAKQAASEATQELLKFQAQKAVDYVKNSPVGNVVNQALQWGESQSSYKQWSKNQDERYAKTKKQLDLEKNVLDLRKDFEKNNPGVSASAIPDSEWEQQARKRMAAEARWSTEGKKPKAEKDDEYERLTKSLNERIEAIKGETAAQAELNPFINDYGFALEKAKVKQELLTAAKKAGQPTDDKAIAAMDDLATKYANAQAGLARLNDEQDKMREKLEQVKDISHDVTRTFIDGMIEGKSATEALGDAVSRLGQRLLDAGLDSLFDSLFQSGGSGGKSGGFNLFDGIKKLFGFADGGYTGDGGKYQAKGVVHGGEYVFSKQAVQRAGVGNLEAMHRSLKGYANGGLVGGGIPAIPRIPSPSELRPSQSQVAVNSNVRVGFDQNGNMEAYIEKVSKRVSQETTAKGIQKFAGSREFKQISWAVADKRVSDPRGRF